MSTTSFLDMSASYSKNISLPYKCGNSSKPNRGRLNSWFYCHRAFRSEPDGHSKDELALNLAFFLASWGMYRGSSFLLQTDYSVHMKAVEELQESRDLANITAEELLTTNSLQRISALVEELRTMYSEIGAEAAFYSDDIESKDPAATDALVTKVLLGTLACMPAYDRYFVDGIKLLNKANQHKHNLSNSSHGQTNSSKLLKLQRSPGNVEGGINTKAFKKLVSWAADVGVFDSYKTKLNSTRPDQFMHDDYEYPDMKIVDFLIWDLGFINSIFLGYFEGGLFPSQDSSNDEKPLKESSKHPMKDLRLLISHESEKVDHTAEGVANHKSPEVEIRSRRERYQEAVLEMLP